MASPESEHRRSSVGVTLVTGLWDVPRRERNPRRRALDTYLCLGQFTLSIDQNLVIFVDPDLMDAVLRIRRDRGLIHRTEVIARPIEELVWHSQIDRITAAHDRNPVLNTSPSKDTPLYAVMGWSKLALVEEVSARNPFSSERFGWIDFGVSHVAQTMFCVEDRVFEELPERVKLLARKPVDTTTLSEDLATAFAYNLGILAAGYITGGAAPVRRLCTLLDEQIRAALDACFAPSVEQLLPRVWARAPDLFELYRGDYSHILDNYRRLRGSGLNLLFQLRALRAQGDLATTCAIGEQILAGHRAGTFVADAETLSSLLDEHFIAAYHRDAPAKGAARAVAEYYRELVAKDRAFAAVYARHREHIDGNFAWLERSSVAQHDGSPAPTPQPLDGAAPDAAPVAAAAPRSAAARPTPPAGSPRICLNMIVKNEAAIIERCLASVLPAIDHYLICDTGSRDDTVGLIERFFAAHGVPGAVRRIRFKNFEHARNRALELCRASPAEFDYILLVDADMELVIDDPAFRTRLAAPAYLVRQRNVISYDNIRLLRREVPARYVGATHEMLAVEGTVDTLAELHFFDHACGASRADKFRRDIRLLRAALREQPNDPRTLFYLAQSYKDAGQHRKAISYYEQRIAAGGWAEEIWYSRYMIARCHLALGDEARFIANALAAYEERPTRAEPLYWLARHSREQGHNETCRLFCAAGQQIPYPAADRLFIEDHVYATGFTEELSIAGFYCASAEHKRAGFEACIELMSHRGAAPATRELATRNASHYAPLAQELFGELARAELTVPCRAPFAPTNPSVCVHRGALHAVVRTVNWRYDDSMCLRIDDAEGVARTENFLVTLDDDLRARSCQPMYDRAPADELSAFPVRGFEDCRLVSCRDRLWCTCTVRDRNPQGRCEVAVLELDAAQQVVAVHVQRSRRPELHQKNWVPLVRGDELYLVYATDPTEVLRFDFETGRSELCRASIPSRCLEDFRGGSQAIAVPGGWLYAIHQVAYFPPQQRVYLHRFVLLDEDFAVRHASEPFCFFARGIEFCAGIARDEARDRLLVSFGTNDRQAFVVALSEQRVLEHLARTPPLAPRPAEPA